MYLYLLILWVISTTLTYQGVDCQLLLEGSGGSGGSGEFFGSGSGSGDGIVLTVDELFPFGETYGDTRAPPADDSSFGPNHVETPIIFFQNEETAYYVSTNGLISFRSPFTSFRPQTFSTTFSAFLDPIIAPLWSDFDIRNMGSIYYRSTNDSVILARTVDIVTNITSTFDGYQPVLTVVVTWDRVPRFGNPSSMFTFQTVLSTDGRVSLAVFLYQAIQSVGSIRDRNRVTGFNAGDRTRLLNVPLRSLNPINVFRIDGNCITAIVPERSSYCPLNSASFECDAEEMSALSCSCDEGVVSPLCLGFFPFGERNGDEAVPRAIDRSQGPIPLSVPIVFYQTMETNFYVSTNGLISFQSPFSGFRVTQFPFSSVPLIAPLWADYDFREAGNVFYRVTEDELILRRAREMIVEANPEFGAFYPLSCIVVTWSEANLFSREASTVTFQVILSTDGEISFATIIYNDFLTARDIATSNGAVGFDAGDQSRSATVFSADQQDLPLRFFNTFRIDGNCITTVFPADTCELNSTSLECVSNEFRASSCFCKPGFTDNRKCQLTAFMPFGIGNGDRVGPPQIDASTDRIHLNDPIVFYNKEETDLFISTNGFVSFENEFITDSFIVTGFPRTSGQLLALIAPLWADFNFRDGGTLYYRVSHDENVLDDMAKRIALENPEFTGYTPTEAVIITWFQSRLFRINLMANFQAVLLTDGAISFAIFLYENLEEIITSIDNVDLWEIGFDSGTTRSSASLVPSFENVSELYFRIDGSCVVPVVTDFCGANSIPVSCQTFQGILFSRTCLCNKGYRPNDNNTCLEFLQFEARAGDTTIPLPSSNLPDVASISLSIPIIFYEDQKENLQIHVDGFMTFGTASDLQITGLEFNLSNSDVPAISPINSELNRADDVSFLHYRVAMDEETLLEVVNLITELNPGLADFQPSLAIVATWQITNGQDINNKFLVQCIIATDGSVSFALFLYSFSTEVFGLVGIADSIGFSSGDADEIAALQIIERRNIFRIDGSCITLASPGSVCGLNSVAVQCNSSLSALRCSCNPGFESVDGLLCKDIDECSLDQPTHNCDQICVNTIGGFDCICEDGYQLQLDNRTCQDINECLESSPCSNNEICMNTEGSFTCEVAAESSLDMVGISVGVVVGGLALLVGIAIIILGFCLHYRGKKKHTISENGQAGEQNQYIESSIRIHTVQSSFKHNLPKYLVIPSCNLKLGTTLGQGEFGIVYQGLLKSSFSDTISDTVAVKTLRGFVEKRVIRDLLKECAKMYTFDHPNVLKLRGVCLDGGPAPYIIMPFMANGSLLAYLRKEREQLVIKPEESDDESAIEKRLLDMCLQVAKGMEYLASKRVIHRDLAARNCMIDVNFIIKVADFGLSESIDTSKDYFRQDQDVAIKLPIKWLAPESINDVVFSEKSDVWSYGVTCWEIFSGGKTPYPGIHPVDLPHQLDNGLRMEKPLNAACTDEIYYEMMRCWETDPHLRPSFAELVAQLSSQLGGMADYLDFASQNSSNNILETAI